MRQHGGRFFINEFYRKQNDPLTDESMSGSAGKPPIMLVRGCTPLLCAHYSINEIFRQTLFVKRRRISSSSLFSVLSVTLKSVNGCVLVFGDRMRALLIVVISPTLR